MSNGKKLVFWLIGIMVISFIAAGIVLVITGGVFAFDKVEVIDQEVFSIQDIERISVDVSSTDIEIIPIQGGEASASLYKVNVEKELNVYQSGNKVDIMVTSRNITSFGIGFRRAKLALYIPQEYSKSLTISSSSADVKINNFTLDKFKCNASSGDLFIDNIIVNNARIETSSGDIKGNNFNGELDLTASSGDINLKYLNINSDVEIKTKSGDVTLSLNQQEDFYLKVRTSSGDIRNKLPISVAEGIDESYLEGKVGDGGNILEIETSSGDVRID